MHSQAKEIPWESTMIKQIYDLKYDNRFFNRKAFRINDYYIALTDVDAKILNREFDIYDHYDFITPYSTVKNSKEDRADHDQILNKFS